jgi:hypothetical protein
MRRLLDNGMAQAGIVEVHGQKYRIKQKFAQRANRLQAMKDHNERIATGAGDSNALMLTLPMTDVLTLKAMGINALSPNDDDMKKIMVWAKENRPNLVGDKFKDKRDYGRLQAK